MAQEVKIGQTDYSKLILIRSSTTGAPVTDLTFESLGHDASIHRMETDNDVTLIDGDLATLANITAAHADWGFIEVNKAKAPGIYRLDLPDSVFTSGAWSAVVSIIITGCDPVNLEFELVPENPYDGVKVNSIADNAITATAINADAITNAKIADDAIAVENIKDAAITAAKIASDAIEAAKIKDGAITNAKVADDVDVNVKTMAAGVITATVIADGAIDAATFAADVDAEIAAMIWNAAVASYGGAGTYGQAVEDALADTNELQADWVNGGRLDLILDIIAADTTTDIPATITALKAVADLIEDIVRNQLEVTDADGKVILRADNSVDALYTVAACITDNSTTTIRKRLA